MKTGAVIAAAGMSSRMQRFKPLLPVGQTSMVKHVIETLRAAGVFPIVVVTGNHAQELEEHLLGMDVVCLRNLDYAHSQMFDSACIGLRYLQHKCDRILFTPVDIPMVSIQSIKKLLQCGKKIACPSYNGKKGHPLLLHAQVLSDIFVYRGAGGLRGALASLKEPIWCIPVDDAGVLMDADTKQDYQAILELAARRYDDSHPQTHQEMPDQALLDFQAVWLLFVLRETGSLQKAQEYLHMPPGQAFHAVRGIETYMGGPLLIGVKGEGNVRLTQRAQAFVDSFLNPKDWKIKELEKILRAYDRNHRTITYVPYRRLVEQFDMPEPVKEHSLAVAYLAVRLACALCASGCILNIPKIYYAALLHDVAKGQKNHARVGADWIANAGFPELAPIIASHMELCGFDAQNITESTVVYWADKHIKGKEVVLLADRFQSKAKLFAENPQALLAAQRKYGQAQQVERLVIGRLMGTGTREKQPVKG